MQRGRTGASGRAARRPEAGARSRCARRAGSRSCWRRILLTLPSTPSSRSRSTTPPTTNTRSRSLSSPARPLRLRDPMATSVPQPAFEVLAAAAAPLLVGRSDARSSETGRCSGSSRCFPFALLLAGSLYQLLSPLRRAGSSGPCSGSSLLSPAVLPSFNFMLDVPALALGLTSIVGLHAHRLRGGMAWSRAAMPGLLAGLAMQTKYSSSITARSGRWGSTHSCSRGFGWRSADGGGRGPAVFAGWEGLMALQYGDSHFLHARAVRGTGACP